MSALSVTWLGSMSAVLTLGVSACSPASTSREPSMPTTAGPTVGLVAAMPGADEAPKDEHEIALLRQLTEPFHRRADKDEQLLVPLADANNWKRVRFWLVDHFTGFRYGEDFDALNVVFIHDVEPGVELTSEYCMKNAERWARPQLRAFDVRMGPIQTRTVRWKHTDVSVRTADALVDYGVGPSQFSAAWAAYPAYEDACLVFAFAVPWGEHRDLAVQVRDRWIEEGVRRLKPLTAGRPHRIDD